jgi:hypothetical protein
MTPDDPDLPGRERGTLPPLGSNRRPLTEYGTAQRMLHLFTPAPGTELEPVNWEQAPPAFEERRKVDPAMTTPFRPLGGYGLGIGRTAPAIPAEALDAIGDASAVPTEESDPAQAQPVAPADALGGTSVAPRAAAGTPETADLPAGAVPGSGTSTCPPEFPIKGNLQSKIYHTTASRSYGRTIAEVCFATPEAAEAAGYRAAQDL